MGVTKAEKKSEKALRRAILATALEMNRSGLSPGRSGNISARFSGGMLITPSGMAYEEMAAEDVVFVGSDGTPPPGQRKPSSEWHFHLAAYAARPDRHAVVHTHSLYATVLACARKPIPAFHYMVALGGGNDIPCVPYATFGTPELATLVAAGLENRDACLMANHGAIAIAETLPKALEFARELEVLAEQYFNVLLLGAPNILSDSEMKLMVDKFKHYGQKAQDER